MFGDEPGDKVQEAQIALQQLQQLISDQEELRNLSWYVEKAIESQDVEHIIEELDKILEY